MLLLLALALLAYSQPSVATQAAPQLGSASDPNRGVESEEWKAYMHQLSSVTVSNQRLSTLLGPVLNYQFSLPEVQLRKGLVHVGANFRLRRVVRVSEGGRRGWVEGQGV